METTGPTVLLEVEHISKRFGATQALTDVNFDIRAGEIHALTGENGAGKSTLMNVISGNYPPDQGTITVNGSRVAFSSPNQSRAAGIAIIHQELNTIPEMTVAENLSLGVEPRTKLGLLDRRTLVASASEKLALVGADIDPNTRMGRLKIGMQQLVEIARAISENAEVLVLDEPTAALSQAESQRLFALLHDMRDRGMGLVYISHRMEEVWALADRITVLRDGQVVGTRDKADVNPSEIVRMMVGREVRDLYLRSERSAGEYRLEVIDLVGENGIGPVSFGVRAGEVVGLVGLVGAGRTEVARMIYGADKTISGTVLLDGQPISSRSPQVSIRSGVALLPESRKDQALFMFASIVDNVSISTLWRHSLAGLLSPNRIRRWVRDVTEPLQIRAASEMVRANSLSGGNQQKVVLARMLAQEPKLLLLDEPTRGVDVGAKSEIYRIINDIAKQGTAVLVVSSDLPEALGISDRLLVMRGGVIVAELEAESTTEEEVMEYATGVMSEEELEQS